MTALDWIMIVLGMVSAQLPWILHKGPEPFASIETVAGLSKDEILHQIKGSRKYLIAISMCALLILIGCILACASGIGAIAYLATAFVGGALVRLYIEAFSHIKLLQIELVRREAHG